MLEGLFTRRACSLLLFAGVVSLGLFSASPGICQHKFWSDGEKQAADVAIRELQLYLLKSIKDERGVHVETLMAAAGAIAGFSAQYTIRKTVVEAGVLPLHGGRDFNAGAFVIAQGKDGQEYYYGDLLNSYLLPQAAPLGPGPYTLYGFLSYSVKKEGGRPTSKETLVEIFKSATRSAGSGEFGRFTLPEKHWPKVPARELLNRYWSGARGILSKARSAQGTALPVKYWPAACALATSSLVKLVKKALSPELVMRVALEAAIPMSKVDPKTVRDGL